MKYFTRERYLALQNSHEEALDAADVDWEQAVDHYQAYLQTIRPEMPETVRQLIDGYYLHDARVLSMGQRGERFIISLLLDCPPNDLLTITYMLAGPPRIDQQYTFPWVKSTHAVDWLYDEIAWESEGERNCFLHSILFSNGWEIHLPLREVQTTTAFPLFPHPRSSKGSNSVVPATQSA